MKEVTGNEDSTFDDTQATNKQYETSLHEQEKQIVFSRSLLETIPNPVFYKDRRGIYNDCNSAFEEFIDRPREEIIGKDAYSLFPKEIADTYYEKDNELLASPGKATVPDGNGGISGILGVILDITEMKRYEEKVRQSADQLEGILDHIPGLVFYKDKENHFIRVNKYFAEANKKDKKQLEGVSCYDLYSKEDAHKYYEDDLAVINSGMARLNIEEPWSTPDGMRWLSTSKIPFIDNNGETIGVIGISMDITKRRHDDQLIQELILLLEIQKEQALKSARIDVLTGIANRRHFDDSLNREFFRLKRNRMPLSLIILDIDHFKKYNDLYGHMAGDNCLRLVATTLQDTVKRPSDVVARFGGEEFAVILPGTEKEGASNIAEQMRRAIEALAIPHDGSENGFYVTISLGLATLLPDRVERPEAILEIADGALYRAKQNGRNRIEIAPSEVVFQSGASAEGKGLYST